MNRHLATALATALLCLPASGCAEDAEDAFGTGSLALVDGQPDAIGLLRFLNDASTTFEVLDQDVRLDRRAAENLVAFRDGLDGEPGRRFVSVDDVLGVRWVGPASVNRMLTYARAHGWIPEGDDLLGVYKGVTFSVTEAELTLMVANVSPHAVLRDDVGLQTRTVNQIVAARPILSVEALSNVTWVGTVSLERLRSYALSVDPPVACFADEGCDDDLRCRGADPGAGVAGVCRHDSELLGVFDGVAFTVGEADGALVLVNLAEEAALSRDVGLTARAAENVVAARPIATIDALSSVAWIGPASLERVRDFVRTNPAVIAALLDPPAEGPCQRSEDCPGDQVCAIFPTYHDPSGVNECLDADTLLAHGRDCPATSPLCGEGLICVGLTWDMPWGGMCSPDWMATTLELGGFSAAPGQNLSVDFSVSGLASVPMDAVFLFTTAESTPDVVLTLENPYENVVPVWPHPAFPGTTLDGRHVVYTYGDEAVNGSWRLLVDNRGDATVTVDAIRLYLTSRWD